MTEKYFEPLGFEVYNIGKHIKPSKKRFQWKFHLDGKEHIVELISSFLSCKRKALVDGNIVFEAKKHSRSPKVYSLSVLKHQIMIYEFSYQKCDLHCDNISFHLEKGHQFLRPVVSSQKIPRHHSHFYNYFGEETSPKTPPLKDCESADVSPQSDLPDKDFEELDCKYSN